jgi:hypothetical protein
LGGEHAVERVAMVVQPRAAFSAWANVTGSSSKRWPMQ